MSVLTINSSTVTTYLGSIDLTVKTNLEMVEKLLTIDRSVFSKLIQLLINGDKDFSDLFMLPEISTDQVNYFILDGASSAIDDNAKYNNLLNRGLTEKLEYSLNSFSGYAALRFQRNDDFCISPNITGSPAVNESTKTWNSFVGILTAFKQNVNVTREEETILVRDPCYVAIISAESLYPELATFTSGLRAVIDKMLTSLIYLKDSANFSYLNPTHVVGFVARELNETNNISPSILRSVIDETIDLSTSNDTESIDGYELIYSATPWSDLNVNNMQYFDRLRAVRGIYREFYSSFSSTAFADHERDAAILSMINNILSRFSDLATYIEETTNGVIQGRTTW